MAADEAAADEAAIAALRRRADAGDVGALVELGDLLYWDEPEAARAAYQEAVDAGQLQALIGLGMVLRNVLGDEEAARAAFDRAAASGDPDVRAEAMYEIACDQMMRRDAAAAAMFRRVIETRHPTWAAAAMVGLGKMLKRDGDREGAEALYRDAVEAGDADWSAHASCLLGDVLKGKGDVAGATAAWRQAIEAGCGRPGPSLWLPDRGAHAGDHAGHLLAHRGRSLEDAYARCRHRLLPRPGRRSRRTAGPGRAAHGLRRRVMGRGDHAWLPRVHRHRTGRAGGQVPGCRQGRARGPPAA